MTSWSYYSLILVLPFSFFWLDNTWSIFLAQFTVVEILSKKPECLPSKAVVPKLVGIRTNFVEDSSSTDQGWGAVWGWFKFITFIALLLLHQLHLRSLGIRSQRLGIPALKHIWSPCPCHRTKFSLLSQASSRFVTWPDSLISPLTSFLWISHSGPYSVLNNILRLHHGGLALLLFSASYCSRSLPSSLPCFIHVYSQMSSQGDLLSLHYLRCMIPAHNPPFPYLGFLLWSLPDFVIFISLFLFSSKSSIASY